MRRSLILTVLLFLAANAGVAQLLAPSPGDLVSRAGQLSAADLADLVANPPETEREPLFYSRAISPTSELKIRPEPPVVTSKSYSLTVDGADLVRGVPIHTLGVGAVVRVHAVSNASWRSEVALDPANLTITSPLGASFADGAGMDMLVDAGSLQAAATPFPQGTSVFRLRRDLGAGRFVVSAPELEAEEGRFRLYVFDRESDVELSLRTDAMGYLHGSPFEVTVELSGAPATGAVESRGLEFVERGDASFVARGEALAQRAGPGLNEIAVTFQGRMGDRVVVRDARVPYAVARETASLRGDANVSRGRGLRVELGIAVEASGRYEVRGVLFGTDAAGELRPAAVAHAAAWLEVGAGTLELRFGPDALAGGLRAPFELRDLQLNDQGRMAVLHRQARAWVIEP